MFLTLSYFSSFHFLHFALFLSFPLLSFILPALVVPFCMISSLFFFILFLLFLFFQRHLLSISNFFFPLPALFGMLPFISLSSVLCSLNIGFLFPPSLLLLSHLLIPRFSLNPLRSSWLMRFFFSLHYDYLYYNYLFNSY